MYIYIYMYIIIIIIIIIIIVIVIVIVIVIIIVASFNASPHAPCTLRTEKHKALLKDEEWAKLPSKVQESPYFSDGKLLFDAERLGTWDFIGISLAWWWGTWFRSHVPWWCGTVPCAHHVPIMCCPMCCLHVLQEVVERFPRALRLRLHGHVLIQWW